MLSEHLRNKANWSLLEEVSATRNLLTHGVKTIREAPGVDMAFHPILALLAPGVERLHKLTLGVCALEARGGWLTYKELKNYRHGIVGLHEDVLGQMELRTSNSTSFVKEKVLQVQNDMVLPPLVKLLDKYATDGRYFDVDVLAGKDPAIEPRRMWGEVELSARQAPTVKRALKALNEVPLSESSLRNRAVDVAVTAELAEVAASVERLWACIAVVGENGAYGVLGRKFGAMIRPDKMGWPHGRG